VSISVTQRDRLADVRQRARDLRERRTRARELHGAARDAAASYQGDDIQNSEEFLRLQRASGDLDSIANALELVEAEERFVLSSMAGIDGPVSGEQSFLHDPRVLEQLQHMATSQAPIGRQDLGYALTRDEYMASIQRTSIYERSPMMAAAGDVVVPAAARGGYFGGVPQLGRPLTLLDLLPVQRMDTGSFDYTPISGNLDTAAEVVDLAVKATADITLGAATAKAQTIAHYHKMSKPQMADAPQLQVLVENRMVYGVNRRIEQAVINGTGVDPILLGILNTSGIGAPASVTGDTVNADLVLGAKTSVRKAGGSPNGIVMHPDDVQAALKVKASGSGVRLDSNGAFGAVPTTMWGLNLVENVAVPKGKAIVADFALACTLFVREGVHVIVSDADQNDFTANRLTALAEARVAFAVWQPSAIAVSTLSFAA
jgi:hypothetical protein